MFVCCTCAGCDGSSCRGSGNGDGSGGISGGVGLDRNGGGDGGGNGRGNGRAAVSRMAAQLPLLSPSLYMPMESKQGTSGHN